MKAQELKEFQDKSLKISVEDYQSGNFSKEDYDKFTTQEQVDYIADNMVQNINTNVMLRGEEIDNVPEEPED